MSNQLSTQANTLAKILAANRLSKSAEQQIDHKGLLDQDNLGKEQATGAGRQCSRCPGSEQGT